MAKRLKTLRCPTCRTIVLARSEDFPFCSDRCRVIDLGKWASGGYVVSTPAFDLEADSSDLLDESKRPQELGSVPPAAGK